MIVTIDDAGWGCPVGGVLIAGLNEESGTFAQGIIAPEFFQAPKFSARLYLDEAAKCTEKILRDLGVRDHPELKVHICSGFVHRRSHAWLSDNKIPFEIVKVQGPLQSRIESALLAYLNALGFKYDGSTEEYGRLFYQAIRWLKGGDPNLIGMAQERLKVAKSGWESFQYYCNNPYHIAKLKAENAKKQARWARERQQDWNRQPATADED